MERDKRGPKGSSITIDTALSIFGKTFGEISRFTPLITSTPKQIYKCRYCPLPCNFKRTCDRHEETAHHGVLTLYHRQIKAIGGIKNVPRDLHYFSIAHMKKCESRLRPQLPLLQTLVIPLYSSKLKTEVFKSYSNACTLNISEIVENILKGVFLFTPARKRQLDYNKHILRHMVQLQSVKNFTRQPERRIDFVELTQFANIPVEKHES